jgi:hypothetical protein
MKKLLHGECYCEVTILEIESLLKVRALTGKVVILQREYVNHPIVGALETKSEISVSLK